MKSGMPPHVIVHDLAIHPRDRDLVVGTHGRSIYVIDVSSLEQMTPDVLNADHYLFDVRATIVFDPKKVGKDSKAYSAPNPPFGATIWYYLKEAATQPVIVSILAKDGSTLATLKGEQERGIAKGTVEPPHRRRKARLSGRVFCETRTWRQNVDQVSARGSPGMICWNVANREV